ncbi:hypothetical protein F4604DRAFT_1935872 [Suillus subluteus]|nr:hypothetical protein F4604DRAFT_1935872 [Suillus subluteus]
MTFVKKLTFESNDLGIDVNLLLTFDDQSIADGLYKSCYPSAFAVRKFGAEGTYRADVTYRSQLAFTKVTVSNDVIQSASTNVPINVGQSTHFNQGRRSIPFFLPEKNIQCTNNAPFKEDIGVGFIEKEGDAPKTTLVWRDVARGQKLNSEFTPVLRGYIGTDYQENCLIKGQVETDRLFEENLAALDDQTTWAITYDFSTGVFSIDRK